MSNKEKQGQQVVRKKSSNTELKWGEEKKNNNESPCEERVDKISVFEPICGPAPQLSLPYWSYNLDTAIKGNLEGPEYTVKDLVEGYLDDNGHPTGNER